MPPFYTASFNSFAARKAIFLLALIDGFAGRWVPSHPGRPLPHLEDAETVQADFVPFLEVPGRQRHQIAQHGFGSSWLSDKAAARCLSVTVICGAAFAGAAAFLAAGAAFFAGGMTISWG